ncbi:MAG: hypothetical protein KAH57_11700 [Thermoplasmata archaeon]|nr:hypothetical protein [Thermoplasmata archaeon]
MAGKKSKKEPPKAPVEADLPTSEEVENRFNLLKNLQVKTGSIKKDIAAYKRSLGSGSDDAGNLWEKLDVRLNDITVRWEKEKVAITLSLAQKGMEICGEKKISNKFLSKEIGKLEGKLEKGELESVEAISSRIRGRLEKDLKGMNDVILMEAWNGFEKGVESFKVVAESPAQLKDARKYYKKAWTYAKKGDIDNLLVYANLLYTKVTSELSDDVVQDRFKVLKEDMGKLMEIIKEFKQYGLDADDFERELMSLEISFDPKKYKEIKKTVAKVDRSVSRFETEYIRRKGNINLINVQDMIQRYGDMMDLSDLEERVGRIEEEKTLISPKKLLEDSDMLFSQGQALVYENFRGGIEDRMGSLEGAVAGSVIADRQEGAQIKDLIQMSRDSLDGSEISEAMEYLDLAEEMFQQREMETRLVTVKDGYGSLLSQYGSLLNEDLEMVEIKEMILEAEDMFLMEEMPPDEIEVIVERSKDMLGERMVEVRKRGMEKERTDILEIIDTIGLSKSKELEYVDRLDHLEADIGKIDDDSFNSELSDIRSDLERESSQYFRDHYDEWYGDIRTSIEGLMSKGVEANSLYDQLNTAGKRYRDKDYVGSGETLRGIRENISNLDGEVELGRIESLINSAEFMFDEAKRAGVPVDDERESLISAKKMLSSGDLAPAARLATKVETQVKERWMEKRRDILKDEIEGLKDYVEESLEFGLDITEANSLISEAEVLFKEDRFDEVDQVVGKARDSVAGNRNSYFSESSMNGITQLKEEILEVKEIGLDSMELETLLIEAERSFMGEDYEKAYSLTLDIREKLGQSKEVFLKEMVPSEMQKVLQTMNHLEATGIDTEPIKMYMDYASQMESNGDLSGAFSNLQKATDVSDELFKSHVSLTIPDTLVDVKKEIDEAIGEGIELFEVKELLNEAEDSFSRQEYDDALDFVNQAQDEVKVRKENHFKEQYSTRIQDVETLLKDADDLNIEVGLTDDNINMARDAFERGDFKDSFTLLDNVYKFLDRSKQDRESMRRREVANSYHEEVRSLLEISKAENLDISNELGIFSMAEELMLKGEYDQAEHLLEGIKKDINDKRLSMRMGLMESSVQTTEILLNNMKDMGLDTTRERELIQQFRQALSEGDLERCDQINSDLEQSMLKNQTPYLISKVEKAISALKVRAMEAHTIGIDTSNVMNMLNRASERYDTGDLDGAKDISDNAGNILDDTINAHTHSEYLTKRTTLNELIEQMEPIGISTEEERMVLEQTEGLMEQGNLDDATSWIEIAITGAEAKLNSYNKMTVEGYVPRIKEYLDSFLDSDVDITSLEKMYKEGMEAYDADDDARAISTFSSILDLGEDLRRVQEKKGLKGEFKFLRVRRKELKEIGMKSSKKLVTSLKKLKKMISDDSSDPGEIRELIEESSLRIIDESKALMETLARKHIAGASRGVKELKKNGVGDEGINLILKEAGTLFRTNDFDRADRAALTAMDMISDLDKVEDMEALGKELSTTRNMINKLKAMGSDVTHAESLFSKAQLALESGKLEPASKLLNAIRESIKDVVRRNLRESCREIMEFTEAMIKYLLENFSGISQKLEPANLKLDQARESFHQKRYKSAQKLAKEAQSAVEELDIQNIQQFLYVFRSMQGEEAVRDLTLRMRDLRKKGIDTSKAELSINMAKERFSNDQFDEGREVVTLSRIVLADLDQQSLHDKAFDELNSAHVQILAAKKKGNDVSEANTFYTRAKEAFALREYKKSLLFSRKVGYLVKKGK